MLSAILYLLTVTPFRSIFALVLLLCAGVNLRAQDPDGAARLLAFTGRLSVMRDGTAWALNTGDSVKPQQMIVTGPDGWGVFQVADGSKFEVYPNSKIVFRANRGDWKDFLEVWLGKVRVQIEHFGGLPNNNKVTTPSAVISVRGTTFDVTVEDESATTLVEDEEGVVEVRHLLKSGTRVLTAGESVRIFKNDPLAKALIDRGSIIQKVAKAASDAFYQAALNARNAGSVARGIPGGGTTTTGSGDKNTGTGAPPPLLAA
ncbi:MAG: FecR family protein, partial [Terriglobia bacterium]